ALLLQVAQASDQRVKTIQVLPPVGLALHGQPYRVGFELGAQRVNLPRFSRREPGDKSPLVWDDIDEVLVLEMPQRLPHGPPRNPERFAELNLVQRRAGNKLTANDGLADMLRNGGGERRWTDKRAWPGNHRQGLFDLLLSNNRQALHGRMLARGTRSVK